MPASDIFSNLEFGAMGLVVARKSKWGFGADAIWMALGTTVRNTDVDYNQGAFAFYGLRDLSEAADLTFERCAPPSSEPPRAFVLLKKLGDFAVTYELNRTCTERIQGHGRTLHVDASPHPRCV